MALHYDTMDGPVVTAAQLALEMENKVCTSLCKRRFTRRIKRCF